MRNLQYWRGDWATFRLNAAPVLEFSVPFASRRRAQTKVKRDQIAPRVA